MLSFRKIYELHKSWIVERIYRFCIDFFFFCKRQPIFVTVILYCNLANVTRSILLFLLSRDWKGLLWKRFHTIFENVRNVEWKMMYFRYGKKMKSFLREKKNEIFGRRENVLCSYHHLKYTYSISLLSNFHVIRNQLNFLI